MIRLGKQMSFQSMKHFDGKCPALRRFMPRQFQHCNDRGSTRFPGTFSQIYRLYLNSVSLTLLRSGVPSVINRCSIAINL